MKGLEPRGWGGLRPPGSRRRVVAWAAAGALCALLAPPRLAHAHAVDASYLALTAQGDQLAGRWRIALADLDATLGLDEDGDGRVSDAELGSRSTALRQLAASRLELTRPGGACSLRFGDVTMNGRHAVLELSCDCGAGDTTLRYDLFFEHDASHQGHLTLSGARELSHVFTHDRRQLTLGAEASWLASAGKYVPRGVHHILIGADHVLFVLTLLIAAVSRPGRGQERPSEGAPPSFWSVARVVTAFTLAHSISLGLAVLQVVRLPSRWVEAAIALSVAAAAFNNVWPVVTRRLWCLAFGFGLVHGLGFASVLIELGMPARRVAPALLGFNLGVELGQLAIVAVGSPLAGWLQRQRPGALALRYGSLAVAAIGLMWTAERWLLGEAASGLASPASEQSCEASAEPATCAAGDALARRGDALARAGRWAEAARSYDDARRHHERAGATGRLAQDSSRLGDASLSAADPSAALGQYERAQAAYASVGDVAGVASCLRSRAIAERLRGDETAAAQLYRRAIELHRQSGHAPALATDLAALARVYLGTGQYGDAQAAYDEANALERQLGRTRALARNHNQLGNLHRLRGDLERAERAYREALRLSREAGAPDEAANQLANLGNVARALGEVEQARDLYEQSLSLFEQNAQRAKAQRVRGLLGSLELSSARPP